MAYIEQQIRQQVVGNVKLWLYETGEEYEHNKDMLFPPYDEMYDAGPLVEAYTFQTSVAVNFRCDALLLNVIDAIAERYDLTRSEVLRRGLHDFIDSFAGEFRESESQLELPVSEEQPDRGEGAEPLRTAQAKRQKTPRPRLASVGSAKPYEGAASAAA